MPNPALEIPFKKLISGPALLQKFEEGVLAVADPVASTMGPRGLNVCISANHPTRPPIITNDGVTVARSIDVADPVANLAAQSLKEAARRTNEYAGDGTTHTTVFARTLYTEALRHIAAKVNPVLLKRELASLLSSVVIPKLETQSTPISTPEAIKQVAAISSGDLAVGGVIADLYEKAGNPPDLTIDLETDLNTLGVVGEFREGLSWDKGVLNPVFLVNQTKGETELSDVPVLLLDLPSFTSGEKLVSIMKTCAEALGRAEMVVVARSFTDSALATAVANFAQKQFACIPIAADVRTPGFFEDLAAFTGATIINESSGISLDKISPAHFGRVARFKTSNTNTSLVATSTQKAALETRIELLTKEMAEAPTHAEVDRLRGRISKLRGGIAILKVGAGTALEAEELRLRCEDAVNACRAAKLEGIVSGGGASLVRVATLLRATPPVPNATREARAAYEIMLEVLEAPTRQIAINAAQNPDSILEQLRLNMDTPNFGYDALIGEYGDMLARGVIDPFLVVRTALQNAVSAVSTLLTTGYALSNFYLENNPKAL